MGGGCLSGLEFEVGTMADMSGSQKVRGSATPTHLGAADACTRMDSGNPDGAEEVFHPSPVASLVHVD